MTDRTPDGLPDTPGPEATPEQDARARALLALLREESAPIPDDVARRIDAALAEERRSGARPVPASGGTGGADDSSATVTVLPTRRDEARPGHRRARVLGGLAAAAVVVLGGLTVAGALRGTEPTGGSASLASGAGTGEATRVTASGTSYTAVGLPSQAAALVTAARSVPAATAADAQPSPANGSITTAPTPLSGEAVAACVRQLTQGDGSVALAADTGSYGGRPALVVVIPTQGDPSTLDVWVVAPTCSATSADLIEFQRIPAR